MSKLEADIMLLEFITVGMVVPVQNPTVMGYFEPAVKCNSDVVGGECGLLYCAAAQAKSRH